jgi:septum formation protein
MLRQLAGRVHEVITGFVIAGSTAQIVRAVATEVEFVEMDAAAIADYVASDEWRGKAGAYAVQGIGAALVRGVRGSVTNVIGLPLAEVLAALREVGGPQARLARGLPA